jgi:hypothetical protein
MEFPSEIDFYQLLGGENVGTDFRCPAISFNKRALRCGGLRT